MEDIGIIVNVEICDCNVVCKVWKFEVFGNVLFYLFDIDVLGNEDGWIIGQFYGWFGEEWIVQEFVFGVGGVRVFCFLGIEVDVYYFNEGYVLFVGFELMCEKMEDGMIFEEVWVVSKNEIVFIIYIFVIQGNEFYLVDCLMYMGVNLGMKFS